MTHYIISEEDMQKVRGALDFYLQEASCHFGNPCCQLDAIDTSPAYNSIATLDNAQQLEIVGWKGAGNTTGLMECGTKESLLKNEHLGGEWRSAARMAMDHDQPIYVVKEAK